MIKSVQQGTPAAASSITGGDLLRRINGHKIVDIIDYMYFSQEGFLLLDVLSKSEKVKLIKINKPEHLNLGIEFESFLIDEKRGCENNCVFCFMNQLPAGMRESLYFKDDDYRLSFLQGNYISLTNLKLKDVLKIVKMRLSPINISLHTLDMSLRKEMMGNKSAGNAASLLRLFGEAGILLNIQIVCCPGYNSGARLSETIEGLTRMKGINSVSIVPVGLTKHRKNLTRLKSFDKKLALQTLQIARQYADVMKAKCGKRVFYCADEIYHIANKEIPPYEEYDDFPQLENGVGMMRLFTNEFFDYMKIIDSQRHSGESIFSSTGKNDAYYSSHGNYYGRISVVTGEMTYRIIRDLVKTVGQKYDTILCDVYKIKNHYFGKKITVTGLITGADILRQLKGKDLGERLLIPQNMLKFDEDIFQDDMTVAQLSKSLGVTVEVIPVDGAEFLKAIIGFRQDRKSHAADTMQ